MKCREVKKQIRQGMSASSVNCEWREGLMEHTRQCEECRQALALEGLTDALFKAYRAEETITPDNPDLMARITARIRELSEHGVGTWESAVLGLRGWLLGFAAAAALLFSFSVSSQFQLFTNSNTNGSSAATAHDSEAATLSILSEDFISESTRLIDDDGRLIPDPMKLQNKATNNDHK